MEPTREIADDIYRERILRARKLSTGQRLSDSFELSTKILSGMLTGILHENAGMPESVARDQLASQLLRLKKLHDHGIYTPV